MTDEEFREKWIAALRSGDYTQGKNSLRTEDDTFCCIGVACDISPNFKWALGNDGKAYYAVRDDDIYEMGSLHDPGEIGLTLEAQDALIGLNDDQGFTFSEIADVLEAKLYDKTGVVI